MLCYITFENIMLKMIVLYSRQKRMLNKYYLMQTSNLIPHPLNFMYYKYVARWWMNTQQGFFKKKSDLFSFLNHIWLGSFSLFSIQHGKLAYWWECYHGDSFCDS